MDAYADIRGEFEGMAVQIGAGPLKMSLRELDLGGVFIRNFSTSNRVSLCDSMEDGWTIFSYFVPQPCATGRWCGTEIDGCGMLVQRGGGEVCSDSPAGWQDVEISVSDDYLASANHVLLDELERSLNKRVGVVQLPSAYAHSCQNLLLHYLSLDIDGMGESERVPAADVVRQSVLQMLLGYFQSTDSPRRPGRSARHQLTVVRALELLSDDASECFTLEALSNALNVDPSTLNRAFRNVYGLSPYQFILKHRLSNARTAIQAGLPVGQVAHEHGFSSHGEFTRHYARLFQERPSVTLSRSSA